jgi:predicted NUDIX family NTP pyrophosphohydrolase
MKVHSAGILVYKHDQSGQPSVLLGHPGGPYWSKKDLGAWSVPKGEYTPPESVIDAARREFQEEIGQPAPVGDYLDLGDSTRKDGKVITVFAVMGDTDATKIVSNSFEMEWPPHSGKKATFPEIDRTEWFSLSVAATKLSGGQVVFLERLADKPGVEFIANQEQPRLL